MGFSSAAPAIGFARVAIAEAALDLVEDGRGGGLVLERGPGFVDYRRLDEAGATTLLGRVAGETAPRTVLSGDLWDVLRRWVVDDDSVADHVFRSDGVLYSSALTAVADRVDRFVRHAETEEDRAVMLAAGIDPGHGVLRRVRIHTGMSSAAVLAALRSRIGRVRDTSHAIATASEVEAAVERLLALAAAVGSGKSPAVVSHREAVGLVSGCPDDLDVVDSCADTPSPAGDGKLESGLVDLALSPLASPRA